MTLENIVNKAPTWALIAGGAVGLWVLLRPKDAAGLAVSAGKGAVGIITDFAGGVFTGTVEVLTGGAVPATSNDSCCKSIQAYDKNPSFSGAFSISLNCPASDYLKWAASGTHPQGCASMSGVSSSPVFTTNGGGVSVLDNGVVDYSVYGGSFSDATNPLYDWQTPLYYDNPGVGTSLVSVAGIRG